MRMTRRNGSGTARTGFRRAVREVLSDDRGSIAEAVVATSVALLVIGLIATGTVSALSALTTTSSNAERVQEMNILTAKPTLIEGWDDATTRAKSHTVTLPSGIELDSYLWSVPNANGSMFFASVARSGNTSNTDVCADITTVQSDDCVYSSAFHARDLRATLPSNVSGFTTADLTKLIPIGSNFATLPAPATPDTELRFFINAATIGAEGEIQIVQGNMLLAVIPAGATMADYFGSVQAGPGADITLRSPDRILNVSRALIYEAE